MSSGNWNAVGIRDEGSFVSSLYNEPSETYVVQFAREVDGGWFKSLYARKVDDSDYGLLTPHSVDLSFDSMLSGVRTSSLFMNVLTVARHEGKFGGYNWDSVRRIDLSTREEQTILENGRIKTPSPYVNGWISDLQGLSLGEDSLFLKAGLSLPWENGQQKMEYWLCEANVETGELNLLSELMSAYV